MTRGQAAWLAVALVPWGIARGERVFADGFEESCFVDADSDRLPNCVEAARNLDYFDPDTDDDGLGDGDEVLGTVNGLDLPAFGVNPRRKDVLIEHDWGEDNIDPVNCSAHTHRPDETALLELSIAFAAMPIPNPDGSSGIHLVNDVGQGGVFTGGNLVNVSNATLQGRVDGEFLTYKAANFQANRLGIFHYALHTHRYSTDTRSTGNAEIGGDDFIVTLHCAPTPARARNTIMHELGHNLGLGHGGDTSCNYKPNYNSVMNYIYQLPGIDTDCQLGGDGVMNYSIGARRALDENHLDETAGLCNGVGIDWNPQDIGLHSDVARDINPYDGSSAAASQTAQCGGLLTTLTDHDDFAALRPEAVGETSDGVHDPEIAVCAHDGDAP